MSRHLDLLRIALVASSLAAPVALHGQAAPTASRLVRGQVGVGFTLSSPDYTNASIKGGSLYGTLDFGRHFGIDGEIHDMNLFTPDDIGESSYMLGLRYHYAVRRFDPYAKILGGAGRFHPQGSGGSYTHKAAAIGGGLDYALNKRVNIRVIDFEVQRWIGNGLTPVMVTAGAAFRF